MGSLENKLRKKWQDYSGKNAHLAENTFYEVMDNLFKDTDLHIVRQPSKFSKMYLNVTLSNQELSEIYVPDEEVKLHGIRPDFLIYNEVSGKEIYVEVKRQDGWVEGKVRHDGRGNAHERLCKYFTPGILRTLRETSGIDQAYLPFWIIFQGDITRDICHVKEIRFWFDGNETNLTFWRNSNDPSAVVDHFLKYILPLLE